MNKITAPLDRAHFNALADAAFAQRKPGEHLLIGLVAEGTQFVRINGAKIRQLGTVRDASLEVTLLHESSNGAGSGLRKCVRSFTLTGLAYEDKTRLSDAIKALRDEVTALPLDPYAQLPTAGKGSANDTPGELLPIDAAVAKILGPAKGVDLAGIYSSGTVIRAMANSAGQNHWFASETFSLDYSLYTGSQRALKSTFAGSRWDDGKYAAMIAEDAKRLDALERAPKKVPIGKHRTYLAPAAFAELVSMLSWGAIGEASLRQGDSPLRLVRQGEKKLSPRFTLAEDFRGGETPRFNEEGELAPERLVLIENGRLRETLVSSRSAKEYGVTANFASTAENLRSPAVSPGKLREENVLKALGTGLYLSNLHYLNWSDQPGGRVTGMTRYACFWVENGEIVAPIENMRWDDSVFQFFGDALEDLTTEPQILPSVETYFFRGVGARRSPGALLSAMNFAL